MNKYIMIPAEQYERYKALMKSNDEKEKSEEMLYKSDSLLKKDTNTANKPKDFPEESLSDTDYKRKSTETNNPNFDKNSKVTPPPGLPERTEIQQKHYGQQGTGRKRVKKMSTRLDTSMAKKILIERKWTTTYMIFIMILGVLYHSADFINYIIK